MDIFFPQSETFPRFVLTIVDLFSDFRKRFAARGPHRSRVILVLKLPRGRNSKNLFSNGCSLAVEKLVDCARDDNETCSAIRRNTRISKTHHTSATNYYYEISNGIATVHIHKRMRCVQYGVALEIKR